MYATVILRQSLRIVPPLSPPLNERVKLTGLSINSHTGMYGALGCGRMIGQPAADNHYTTSLSRQAKKPVVRPPWNGYIHSNKKGVFLCNTFFCRPTKESMNISHTVSRL